ncbi:MAG TPA: TA system VapC family ribonuclease toxin [Vicinamibacterales bacterium]|nr:TA system VapC family ribonuclease toxin [Vicinamibacterales bacterium]
MKIIDTNLLVYAYVPALEQHAAAKRWFEQTLTDDESVGLAWVSVLGFVRVVTNPRVFRIPLLLDRAVAVVDGWFQQQAVEIILPTPRHWSTLRDMLIQGQAGGAMTTDAHLAALAVEHGATIYTTDRDFLRFPGVKVFNPLQPESPSR